MPKDGGERYAQARVKPDLSAYSATRDADVKMVLHVILLMALVLVIQVSQAISARTNASVQTVHPVKLMACVPVQLDGWDGSVTCPVWKGSLDKAAMRFVIVIIMEPATTLTVPVLVNLAG